MIGLGNPNLKLLAPAVAENYRGTQHFGELPKPKVTPTVSSGYDFMMGLRKPKLCTRFKVASFSRCRNIKGKAPNFGELPQPRATPTFLLVRFDDGSWQKAAVCQI